MRSDMAFLRAARLPNPPCYGLWSWRVEHVRWNGEGISGMNAPVSYFFCLLACAAGRFFCGVGVRPRRENDHDNRGSLEETMAVSFLYHHGVARVSLLHGPL